jgi:hypothetical protein
MFFLLSLCIFFYKIREQEGRIDFVQKWEGGANNKYRYLLKLLQQLEEGG